VEDTVAGYAVLAGIAIVGIIATLSWVVLVSLGIRRDDRAAMFKASSAGRGGSGPGRVARMSRQSTGVHWV
jgi:hypothetical protein